MKLLIFNKSTDLKPSGTVAAAEAAVAGSNAPQPLPLHIPETPKKVSPSRYLAIASLDTEENEAERWAGN